jgi:hypothetical protein
MVSHCRMICCYEYQSFSLMRYEPSLERVQESVVRIDEKRIVYERRGSLTTKTR